MHITIVYVALAIALLSTIGQYTASRAADRFHGTLLSSLVSMEYRTMALLASLRRLLEEQEHRRIIRDAREAQMRLSEQEYAEAIIDIARMNDGQAEQIRRASEAARDRSLRIDRDPDVEAASRRAGRARKN